MERGITREVAADVACYREFEPCEPLRKHVRAFFSFVPPDEGSPERAPALEVRFGDNDSFCSPLFADGHASVVFGFGRTCVEGRGWGSGASRTHAEVIGPTTASAQTLPERREMIGVYFRAAGATGLLNIPGSELTDRTVSLDDLFHVGQEIEDAPSESERIGRVESLLLARLSKGARRSGAVDISGLAAWATDECGLVTVEQMASAAGVSRQQLTRVFRQEVGVTPKLYCRLARFHAALAGVAARHSSADIAAELGYADQSHMIADFREFSSLTPGILATGRWFHPFIERFRRR